MKQGLISFEKHIDQLNELNKALELSKNMADGDDGLYCKVVGLDLVGDEKYLPYLPFTTKEFIEFLVKMNVTSQRRFGARIHFGEISVPSNDTPAYRSFKKHMDHGFHAIAYLQKFLIPLRIGHGVGFAEFVNGNNLLIDTAELLVEINSTSNVQLLSNSTGLSQINNDSHALHTLKSKFPFTLSTDDDGIIWPIEEKIQAVEIVSVACEALRAFRSNLITKEDVPLMAKNGKRFRFGIPHTSSDLQKLVDLQSRQKCVEVIS